MTYAFNSTHPNLNRAVNELNRRIFGSGSSSIISTVGSLVHGGGGVASNAIVEAAVQWSINKASNEYITYSQSNRNLKNPSGHSFDCSSFVITSYYAVGLDVNAVTTADMVSGFTALGWVWHTVSSGTLPASILQRGDILLNTVNHTQVYIGNNQDVNCGSTPAKIVPHSTDNYGRGWHGYLRYGN